MIFDLSLTTRGPNILSILQFINYFLFIYIYSFLHIFIFVTCKNVLPFRTCVNVFCWTLPWELCIFLKHWAMEEVKNIVILFVVPSIGFRYDDMHFCPHQFLVLITKEDFKVTFKTITVQKFPQSQCCYTDQYIQESGNTSVCTSQQIGDDTL